jgi:hypothetical protein
MDVRYFLVAAVVCSAPCSAMATCGGDQQIRYETDLRFCMEYNGSARNLIAARDGMIRNVQRGNSESVLSSHFDCQKGAPNEGNNDNNGRDCEREHPGISLSLAKKYCHGRC